MQLMATPTPAAPPTAAAAAPTTPATPTAAAKAPPMPVLPPSVAATVAPTAATAPATATATPTPASPTAGPTKPATPASPTTGPAKPIVPPTPATPTGAAKPAVPPVKPPILPPTPGGGAAKPDPALAAQNEKLKKQIEDLEKQLAAANAAASGIAPPPPPPSSLFSPVDVEALEAAKQQLEKDKAELTSKVFGLITDNDRLRREKRTLEAAVAAVAPPPPPAGMPPPPPDDAPPPPPDSAPPPLATGPGAINMVASTTAAAPGGGSGNVRPASTSGAVEPVPHLNLNSEDSKYVRATRSSMADPVGPFCSDTTRLQNLSLAQLDESASKYKWETHMTHQFPAIDKQVQAGCKVLRAYTNWMRKALATMDSNAADAVKSFPTTEEFTNAVREDGMTNFSDVLLQSQEAVVTNAKRQQAWAAKCNDSLKKVIDEVKSLEDKRKRLVGEEEKDSARLAGRNAEVEKARMKAMGEWEKLLALKKSRDQEATTKKRVDKLAGIDKDIGKAKEKTKKAFIEFEQLQKKVADEVSSYRSTGLSVRLREMEALDWARLDIQKRILTAYVELEQKEQIVLPITGVMRGGAATLDIKKELLWGTYGMVKRYGVARTGASSLVPLPCTSNDLDTDAWMDPHHGKAKVPMSPTNKSEVSVSKDEKDMKSPTAAAALASPEKADDDKGGDGDDGDDDDDDLVDMDEKDRKEIDRELWVRAIKEHKQPADAQNKEKMLEFAVDEIIKVTEQGTPFWTGVVVGDKKAVSGKFPPDFVVAPDIKTSVQSAASKATGKDAEAQTSALANFIRSKVSKKKRRFEQDGFDLDLSYITPSIIAMGFPSESLAGVYRNPMEDVKRFFNTRHPKQFKIYNLCSEREYKPEHFDGRCARYPFDDHNPCELEVVEPFCKDCKTHLDADKANVSAIHCKAGKGRTGFMIACFLRYSGFSPNADHALKYYAVKRTHNAKGVTIPSQIRYVHYFDRLLTSRETKKNTIPASNPLLLQSITLHSIPKAVKSDGVDVWFELTNKTAAFSSKGKISPDRRVADDRIIFQGKGATGIASIDHDVTIKFWHSTTLGKQNMFQFWFNTRMLEQDESEDGTYRLVLKKRELDKACKDKKHKNYSDVFKVELVFEG